MGTSMEESTSYSDKSSPFTQSLLRGINRVIGFFEMSEDELSQAGINLGYSHQHDADNQMNPPAEFSE